MFVFRITKSCEFTMAKPCDNCIASTKMFLKKYNLKLNKNSIYYTDWNGEIDSILIE